MKRIIIALFVAFISLTLSQPSANAQRHNNRHNQSERKESFRGGNQSASRPSRSPGTPTNQSVRPGRNKDGQSVGNSRPGASNARPDNQATRPGNQGNQGVRPNRPDNNRPAPDNNRPAPGNNRPATGNNGNNQHKPGAPSHNPVTPPHTPGAPQHKPGSPSHNPARPPQQAHRPTPPRPNQGLRPGPSHNQGQRPGPRPVVRPLRHPWTRPVPPPSWRPSHRRPLMPSFLGLTLGMAMNATLNALTANNLAYYSGNNEVILHNVPEQNFFWPQAVLTYNAGILIGSRFFYETSYPDPSRFRNVYNNLCINLGTPVSYTGNGYRMSASWFGYNGDFVTLEYAPMPNAYGSNAYFTILTYGN